MGRHRWFSSALGLTLALITVLVSAVVFQGSAALPGTASVAAAPLPQALPTPVPIPTYNSYSVKFVCGLQRPTTVGEPTVKPGNYATEINIHNYTYARVGVRKKVLVLVDPQQGPVGREPKQVGPRALDTIYLGPDGATMDDCNRIWQLLYPTVAPPSPMPFMSGILVLITRVDVDVDVVYTASAHPAGTVGFGYGISEDVERIPGKRVAIPNNLFPGGPIQ